MAETINESKVKVNESKVKVNEVSKVAPFSGSDSTAPFTLPLTRFDTLWFKFPPVERLFFYEFKDLTSDLFNSIILPKLKHSLSLALLRYLPLAGNILWPSAAKPAIYYFPNDGVSVTVAVSSNADDDFAVLSGNGIRNAAEYHPLIPQLSISEDKAEVIAIQVTLFPNEGFSIGVSSHHAILDGKSSTMFIKSWAYLCKQLQFEQNPSLLPDKLVPCFDRTVIKDPKGLDMVHVKHWIDFTRSDSDPNPRSLNVLPVKKVAENSNLVRMTFELSREDIKKLRDKVNKFKQIHLSSFVVTCAYVFVCLVKAKRVDANTTIKFAAAADFRSRLDPPIPENYFGNCVGGEMVAVKAKDWMMEETGFACAAENLSDYIKGLKGEVIEGSEDKFLELLAGMKEAAETAGRLLLSVAGSNRFEVYGSDFGWGRPKKVEIVSIDRSGAISLADSRDGSGGFEIGVVLEKQQMGAFESLFVNGLKNI